MDYFHHFRPDRANRTKCDICGRTAGAKSHGARPAPTARCGRTDAHRAHTFDDGHRRVCFGNVEILEAEA